MKLRPFKEQKWIGAGTYEHNLGEDETIKYMQQILTLNTEIPASTIVPVLSFQQKKDLTYPSRYASRMFCLNNYGRPSWGIISFKLTSEKSIRENVPVLWMKQKNYLFTSNELENWEQDFKKTHSPTPDLETSTLLTIHDKTILPEYCEVKLLPVTKIAKHFSNKPDLHDYIDFFYEETKLFENQKVFDANTVREALVSISKIRPFIKYN